MELRLYHSPYCPRCCGAGETLEKAATKTGFRGSIRILNVIEHIDEAVAAGVRATPAVTLDGRVILAGGMDPERLERALVRAQSGGN